MNIQDFESEIGRSFRGVVKGSNFMTPSVYGYVLLKDGIAEISTGKKFLDSEIWGVTVIHDDKRCDYQSVCLHSIKEVEDYIEKLNYEDHSMLVNLLNNSI